MNCFWAYQGSGINEPTFIFNTLEDARNHAISNGEFDECSCKESWIEKEENLFFQTGESV